MNFISKKRNHPFITAIGVSFMAFLLIPTSRPKQKKTKGTDIFKECFYKIFLNSMVKISSEPFY